MKYLLIISFVFCLIGCGSSQYINDNYKYPKKEKLKLALLPVDAQPGFADTAFIKIFRDST